MYRGMASALAFAMTANRETPKALVIRLTRERAKVLAERTTTDDEYRDKWNRVNALTVKIADANGGLTLAERKAY